MKAQDFVKATTAYNDELFPAVWDGTTMNPEVRIRLIEIAELFVQYLDVPGFEVYDVVLTGSLANYNWTTFSDFDLHVVTDYRDLQCDDLAEAFYRAKKTIWNDQHDITIYGHEVELYVEDINEPPVSGGVFSVYNGEWLKTPNHQNPNINDTAVVRKVQELQDQIERSIATADDPADLKRLTDRLRKMRQAGLDAGGEFSVENLAFKTLRNMGVIKALHDAYIEKQDDSMRINEVTEGYDDEEHPIRDDGNEGRPGKQRYPGKLKAEGSREQVDPSTVWEVCFDYGPHQSDKVKVKASSQEEAEQKGMRAAKKLGHRFPQLNWAMPADNLNEFAQDDGDGRPKFIPWADFIEGVKGIVGKDFAVTENVIKSTIKARFVPHDPLEFGPTMLYSYYETRAGGRNKGAVSTRGSIQVGKYYSNNSKLGTQNFITTFNLLKGHPFERHFDLTPENISKVANIILGNTEGAYQMQQQGVAEDTMATKCFVHVHPVENGKLNLNKVFFSQQCQSKEQAEEYIKMLDHKFGTNKYRGVLYINGQMQAQQSQ